MRYFGLRVVRTRLREPGRLFAGKCNRMLDKDRTREVMALQERMMECSELCIEHAAHRGEGFAAQAAQRVLESARTWSDWAQSHNQLLGTITMERQTGAQVLAVRRMALSMIHRKAPFEFLRDRQLRGLARRRFFRIVYGQSDYERAMVREHRHYLSAMCSYLCLDRFCATGSLRRIQAYERAYTRYWRACNSGCDASLLRLLRQQMQDARDGVVNAKASEADEKTLEELRQPTGDTQLLRRFPGRWAQTLPID